MLAHALTVVVNELERHLTEAYGAGPVIPQVRLGNIAEGVGGGGANAGAVPRDIVAFAMVNIREEKTLKNVTNQTRNDATLRVVYENPPVFLNFHILVAATHSDYANALLMLSRTIRFFQFKNVFDQGSVAPSSLASGAPANPLDQVETFKLIFDLYSPTMEEVNHLWGTLGGKQYPFVLYTLRLLELKFKAVHAEGGLITDVVSDFRTRDVVTG
jgi:Pvc16 N-terminal domain